MRSWQKFQRKHLLQHPTNSCNCDLPGVDSNIKIKGDSSQNKRALYYSIFRLPGTCASGSICEFSCLGPFVAHGLRNDFLVFSDFLHEVERHKVRKFTKPIF